MGNTLSGRELLPDPHALELCAVEKGEHWVVNAVADLEAAVCPECGTLSTAHHSSYLRHLKDLPIQGSVVQLQLRVGRWRCRNADCERKIFCQRLTSFSHKHSRETKRFGEVARVLAYALGGRPGERLCRRMGLAVSDDTLLRRLKYAAQSHPAMGPIPVLGVDDFAWRKGTRYGTILIDLEQSKVADLLPERSSSSFEQWLRQHSEVTMISRDRHGLYAEGARCGAPAAQQVADRFHLVQNLTQAVERALTLQRHHLVMSVRELAQQNGSETGPAPSADGLPRSGGPQPSVTQRERREQRQQQRAELFHTVKGLHAQGMKASEIVRAVGISRGRVDQWLRLEKCPPRNQTGPQPGLTESLQKEVRLLWEQGSWTRTKLFSEIRKLGYRGGYSSLTRFLRGLREEETAMESMAAASTEPVAEETTPTVTVRRHISPQVAAALLSKARPLLSQRQSEIVDYLKATCPGFATMRHLVLSFRSILCGGKVSSLQRWAEKAATAGIPAVRRFVEKLQEDWAAVENAVEQTWSNGPAEGHINRLKTLKRQMYGRASFELLRARVLPFPVGEVHQE
jgi:transposase